MPIAGVDPDTYKIVVALSTAEGGFDFLIAQGKGRIAEHRFLPLIGQFRILVNDQRLRDVTWLYLERPPMGVNPRSTIDQAMVVGAVACILHERGIPFSLVDSGTWKRVLIGNGRADKPLVKAWSIANLGLPETLTQDEYDSACIARYGQLVTGGTLAA